MRRLKYNSDYMSRQMDKELEALEDRLKAIYANASYDVNAEFAKFAKTFEAKDAEMAKMVAEGSMTDAEYSLWRQRQILQTDLYKASVDKMTVTMLNADITAMATINGDLPMVLAQSYNFVQSLGWKQADDAGLSVGTFQIYNADSVQTIIKDNPDLLKSVDVPVDKKWNKEKINNEIVSSIMKGDPIPKVAENLQKVAKMDENSAIRNARTAMTSAENLGRSESADRLKSQGIPVNEMWNATYDSRTRDTHLMLDGTMRDENGYFGADFLTTPLRYPADPLGDPEEVYNCRCRMSVVLEGIDHSQDGDLYEEFMKSQHPDDWEKMQENKGYKAKQEVIQEAQARKASLLEAKAEAQANTDKPMKEFTEIPAKPERPNKADFDDYDKYLEARDKYREERDEWEKQRDEHIQNMKDKTEPMTRQELTEWADKRGIEILENTDFKNLGSIDEVDPRLLRVMTDRCDELLNEFPQVLDYRQKFMEDNGMEGTFKFTIGYSKDNSVLADGGIGFMFGGDAKDFDYYASLQYDSIAQGYLVNGTGDLRAIVDHEFGHNVQATIATFNGKSETDIGWEFVEKTKGIEGKSEYSLTNENELFAEAFASWYGGNDTELAHQMEEFLKEYGMI